MWWNLLADLVIAVHLAYVSFVVLGQLLIMFGVLFRWGWVRNPWFRLTHFAAIALVAIEALASFECPLTTLEYWLRGEAHAEGFVSRLMHGVLYHRAPEWVFTLYYISFALLVLGFLFLAPPRFRRLNPAVNPAEA